MTDLRCVDDLDLYGAETSSPLEELAQDLYHRLIEEPGSNPDDPGRGLGLASRLNAPIANDGSLEALTEDEMRKDKRVEFAVAKITRSSNGNAGESVRLDVQIRANAVELGLGVVLDADGIRRVA